MRRLALRIAGIGAVYSLYVTKSKLDFYAEAAQECKRMNPMSADAILKENLDTGDLVLFSRRWYNYHLPEAVAIKCYEWYHDSAYDHLGVIVINQKDGEPYILEKCFFSGYHVRPFDQRIIYSMAYTINVISLMPRDEEEEDTSTKERDEQKRKLHNYITALVDGDSPRQSTDIDGCNNIMLVNGVFNAIGLQITRKAPNAAGTLSTKDLINRDIAVSYIDPTKKNTDEPKFFSNQDTMVRIH